MGKVKSSAPDHLTMNLFAPGMSLLHRAGLGGLACTLKAMERQFENGLLRKDSLPGPFADGIPPWDITEQSVTLKFGKPEDAGAYLKNLFAFAFQIRDGVVYLPGQYPDPRPSLAVRAELQVALSRTFLQGAKKNLGLERPSPYYVDPDGTGSSLLEIEFQRCTWYTHQNEWETLIDGRTTTLLETPKKTNIGSFNPGAIVRHSAPGFEASAIMETSAGLMCAIFFLVGCLAGRLSNSGDGVLLVPEVQALDDFVLDRPLMTPRTVSEVRVGGVADAAFQAELRLRARCLLIPATIPSLRAMRFSLRTWTRPQKSRVETVELAAEGIHRVEPEVIAPSERSLQQFEVAMAELPRGIRHRKDESTFWSDSVVRPHIATNLALGSRWYNGFHHLFRDSKTTKQVTYESGGLRAMGKNRILTDDDEAEFISAMHRAIFMARGKIYAETMGTGAAERKVPADQATKNRWNKQMERLRLGLVSSKTMTQTQNVVVEFLARCGTVRELRDREAVERVRRLIFSDDWQRMRNLALLALASYQRPANTEPILGDDNE